MTKWFEKIACWGLLSSATVLVWAADTTTYTTKITAQNAAQLVQGGPDAIGGIDDWFFTNGTLCAIVSGVDHESEFSSKGGSLVDLGFCGRNDDYYTFNNDLLDGSRMRPLNAEHIAVEQNAGTASVIVTSSSEGAKVTTRYSLSDSAPTQLKISKRLSKTPGTDFNFFTPVVFNYESLEPFVFNSNDIALSNGFKNQDFVTRGSSAMPVAARRANTIITPSPPSANPGVAYGWHLASAERVSANKRVQVPYYMLADTSSIAMLILSDTFYLGDGQKIGLLQLLQVPWLSLGNEAQLETQEIIYVGARGDIASVTDQLLTKHPTVTGQLNETNAAIHVYQSNGAPLTHVRPDAEGYFAFKAPAGDYQLKVIGTAQRSLSKSIVVDDNALDLGFIELPTPAQVMLPQGVAMRLVFVGVNDTPHPDFSNTLTQSSEHDDDGEHYLAAVSQVFLAGVDSDPNSVELAPGKYLVYAVRGPEFSLEKSEITVLPRTKIRLNIATPTRVLETPGYIASDLHVHSGISFDNTFSETERIRTFVAEQGEVMVSSEHDVPVDYAPKIKAMGVDAQITSIAAAEVTSLLPTQRNPYTGGHANFFPYYPKPLAYRRGMVNHEDRRLRDVIHDIRALQPNVLVQLNHPRLDLRLSGELPDDWQEIIEYGQYLDHMGPAAHPYDPSKPLHAKPNNSLLEIDQKTGVRDIDFDLIEIINPGGATHDDRIKAIRRDWLSFLKQGKRLVGTANSDSHTNQHQVAVPRTMVAIKDDRVTEFNQTEFIASLKSGNAYGTTGPMLQISLSGKTMGETFSGPRGQLSVNVSTANWTKVDNIKIQINGETIDEYHLTDRNQHALLVPISFTKDSFVTVEVSGPKTDDYAAVYPDIAPYAFSNPIYVDFDSDGEWLAPGL